MLRENGVGFKLRSTLVDFDRWSKSTQSIFGYCKWPYHYYIIIIIIFWDMVNSQISIEDISGQMFVSSYYSGATSLAQITLDFTI